MTRTLKQHADLVAVALAVLISLSLGFAHLGAPSIWHDEAVQVLVSKNLVDTGRPLLPSGHLHPVAPVFNAVMAVFIALFGTAESVVRTPSVLFMGLNVALTFLVFRPLLGRAPALVAAFALALSPWSVAWAREARFYACQQTLYLLMIWASSRLLFPPNGKRKNRYFTITAIVYILGLGVSLHSVLFLAPLGAYAFVMLVQCGTRSAERGISDKTTSSLSYKRSGLPSGRTPVRRVSEASACGGIEGGGKKCETRNAKCVMWLAWCVGVGGTGLLTMVVYKLTLPKADADAIFASAGLGMNFFGLGRLYYLDWLWDNLSAGFFVLAIVGFVLMLVREKNRGLFAALAFWAPLLALTFLIDYHRHRFMFFIFPAYVAAFSYGAVQLAEFLPTARRSRQRALLGVVILIFAGRLGMSAYALTRDSLAVANGADTTLATRHPQWRIPCQYVRDHMTDDTVVVSAEYVSALYYIGRVDSWFPTTHFPAEVWECGNKGLATIDDFKNYIRQHPKGYYLAEWDRLFHHEVVALEQQWVSENMTLIEEASTGDVKVYAWGINAELGTRNAE